MFWTSPAQFLLFPGEAVWKKSSRADVNECRLSFQQCTCALPSGDGSVMGSPTLRPTPSGDSYRCGDSVNGSSIAGNSIRTRATAVTAQGGSRGADGSPVAVLKSLEQAHRHVQRTLEPAVRAQKSPALCSRCRHLKPIFYDLLHRYLLKLDPAARSPLEETLKVGDSWLWRVRW